MRKILACFKIVNELYNLTTAELHDICRGEDPFAYNRRIIAPFDEAALENALRLAEEEKAAGRQAQLIALTVGSADSRFVPDLFAVGFDEVVCLPAEHLPAYTPEAVAARIAAFVRQSGPFDVILTGQQAPYGENAQTPLLLACILGLPCAAAVTGLSFGENGVEVSAQSETGLCRYTVHGPAVYALGEATHSFMRLPTLREKLAMAGRQATEISPLSPPPPTLGETVFLHFIPPPAGRQCRFIEGGTDEEKAAVLWESYIQKAVQP